MLAIGAALARLYRTTILGAMPSQDARVYTWVMGKICWAHRIRKPMWVRTRVLVTDLRRISCGRFLGETPVRHSRGLYSLRADGRSSSHDLSGWSSPRAVPRMTGKT